MATEATDIIVVGGGIAGYAAASGASEHGRRVVVLDRGPGLGGATTQSNVGTLCGLYYRSDQPDIIPHRFCRDFQRALFERDDAARLVSLEDGIHVIAYEWSNLQRLLTEQLTAAGVTLMLRAEVQQVCAAAGEVRGLVVRCDGAPVTMSAASVIDCSGVGSIASLLGHPMISDGTYQSAAQVVRLDRVGPIEEYALGLALRRALLRASNVPASYKRSSIVQGSLRNGRVDLKIPLIGAISDDPAVVATLKHEIDEALPVLMPVIRQIESLRGADVHTIFPTPGVRVQQRPKGEYVLTAQDVLSCRKSADGIAVGVWPVEEWDYEGKVRLDCFAPNDGYEIPAGCLKSPVFHNLYFGGKGISAETRAIASARVTGTCLQTGYAAGKVAACKSEGERRDVIAEIHSQFGEKRG